jgi:hypothetical protein
MTAVVACPAGFYSPAGSQTCFMCQLGFRCDTGAANSLLTYESTASASWNNYFIQVGSAKYYKS